MKDETIKKLVETQNTVLNTISAKSYNQHSNILNQSSSSLPSNNHNENFHNKKQLTSQEPQDPTVARPYSSQLQKISHPTQAHHQRPERNIAVKNIYVGNLPEDITKQDICELFGPNSTSYLRDTCNMDFSINKKTGKFKGFAFIRAPAHITDELIKLDGIAYHDNHLNHLGKGLDNYIGNYDNILLLGDFNSEFSVPCLNDFCDIYNLKNVVEEPTCYKNPENPSCIDLFLTNRPRTFQCTTTIEIGISDFHILVVTVLKTFYKKQRPKTIHYRNYKNFENGNFRQDLLKFDIKNAPLSKFNGTVLSVLDKHAPKK